MATGTAFSDYLEAKILDHIFGNTAYSAPGTVYVALFTSNPTDAASGTEVTGNGYARVAVTNNTTNWPNTSSPGGTKSNGAIIQFPTATPAGWGTVTHVAIFDASSSGNMLMYGALGSSKVVNANDQPKFDIGSLILAAD